MSPSAADLERHLKVTERYEHDFAAWLAEHAVDARSPEIEALWRRALLAPTRDFLRRSGKQFRARLMRTAWELAGGAPEGPPDELPLVVEALHSGSLIVDDIQDGARSRRGGPALHHLFGEPLAINTGNLLYAWALDLIGNAPVGPGVALELYRRTSTTMLRCHHGQGLDLTSDVAVVPRAAVRPLVETITRLKASELMGYAAAVGALGAGADPGLVSDLEHFGRAFGQALQRLDDLGSVARADRREKSHEDLGNRRPTWVWAWAAGERDEGDYAALQARLRGCVDGGQLHLSQLDAVANELAACVLEVGRRDVHAQLHGALDLLRARVGQAPALTELEQEATRLEASYV